MGTKLLLGPNILMLSYNAFEAKLTKSLSAKPNISLSDKQLQQLFKYTELLLKWNKVYSLTAIIDMDSIINLHLLDALVIMPYLHSSGSLLDVGSGMGVPGIVIAIFYPQLQVTLIDSANKKCAFLQQVAIELSLTNVSIIHHRVERFTLSTGLFDMIICRAFSSVVNFINLSKHLLSPKGEFLLMKSQNLEQELVNFTTYAYEVIDLNIPEYNNQRFLLKIANHE